jgi:hypothetical protein
MCNRSESGDLKWTGGESNPDLTEFLWMSGDGVARAQVQADGTIKGVRFSDDGDDKEADKIKARRLPRFEALIPDELARCVDVENGGAWSGISPSGTSGGLVAGELLRSP